MSNCHLPNQNITRDGTERHKMAQMKNHFLEKPVPSIRYPTPSPSSIRAIQLYDNEKNGTKWNKMEQFFRKRSE